MRNEVVVLVLLYFGAAPEFILPLGGVELGLKNNARKYNKKVLTTVNSHTVELSKDKSIIEKDLYEYGVPKKNQSERAFVYIHKKYMKPNIFQRLKNQQNEQNIYDIPTHIGTNYTCECKPKDHNSYFIDHQPFKIVDMKSYSAQMKKNKDKEPCEHKMVDDSKMLRRKDLENRNNIDISRSLMLSSLYASTESYDSIPNQKLPSEQYIDFDKLRYIRKSLDFSKFLRQESKNKLRETYGYNSPYVRHRDLEVNGQLENFGDSLNIQDLLAGDFDPEKSDYDDKLDKYLKEDLDEEPKSNDDNNNTLDQKHEEKDSGNNSKCKCIEHNSN